MKRRPNKSRPPQSPTKTPSKSVDGFRRQPPQTKPKLRPQPKSRLDKLKYSSVRTTRKLRQQFAQLDRNHKLIATTTAGLIIVAAILLPLTSGNDADEPTAPTSETTTEAEITERNPDELDIAVLTPGDSTDQIEWVQISPPENDPVYAFVDTIGENQIQVSQQALPDSVSSDPEAGLRQIAEDFGATRQFDTGRTAVFVGVSETGTQSLIFAKNELLVLIRSDRQLSDNRWSDYINQLN